MKLYVSFLVVLMMMDACWSQCKKVNWWGSFDKKGWSTCGSDTMYMNALYRNERESGDPIYLLEEVYCCPALGIGSGYASTCINENWWGVLDNKHIWAVCPVGYYMQGLYRTEGDNLYNIEEARCCKPENLPNTYQYCFTEDVSNYFDWKGWSICPFGYFMAGIYKGDCEGLQCIEKFKCCLMLGSLC